MVAVMMAVVMMSLCVRWSHGETQRSDSDQSKQQTTETDVHGGATPVAR